MWKGAVRLPNILVLRGWGAPRSWPRSSSTLMARQCPPRCAQNSGVVPTQSGAACHSPAPPGNVCGATESEVLVYAELVAVGV